MGGNLSLFHKYRLSCRKEISLHYFPGEALSLFVLLVTLLVYLSIKKLLKFGT
jgi:hypothetical protein